MYTSLIRTLAVVAVGCFVALAAGCGPKGMFKKSAHNDKHRTAVEEKITQVLTPVLGRNKSAPFGDPLLFSVKVSPRPSEDVKVMFFDCSIEANGDAPQGIVSQWMEHRKALQKCAGEATFSADGTLERIRIFDDAKQFEYTIDAKTDKYTLQTRF